MVPLTTQLSPGPHAGSSGNAVCSPGRQLALCLEPSQLAAGECRPGKGWKGPQGLRKVQGLFYRAKGGGYPQRSQGFSLLAQVSQGLNCVGSEELKIP